MSHFAPLSRKLRRDLGLRPGRPRPIARLLWRRRRSRYGPPLILLGYWSADEEERSFLPNAAERVDPAWDPAERRKVVEYLRAGSYAIGYMGWSACRLCARHNGSQEFTDGVYLWPEGLAHYVEDHEVRLPASFVAHAISAGHPPGRSNASVLALLEGSSPDEQTALAMEQLASGTRLMRRGVDLMWWLATQGTWDA